MEVREFKAKTVDEAITAATLELGISSDQLEYKVIDEGSKGFLGIFNTKPAVISVTVKKSLLERTQAFCEELFLYVNRESDAYIRVKLDTENYRERRKVTLEKLAKKIAYTVKRTKKPVALEPMNPYERRVIHSALQNDRYVCTKSEGEEPYRKVVIMLKRDR